MTHPLQRDAWASLWCETPLHALERGLYPVHLDPARELLRRAL